MLKLSFWPRFEDWQRLARRALQQGLRPSEVDWQELSQDEPVLDLFAEAELPSAASAEGFRVPSSFLPVARRVATHAEPGRWALLYRVLWRLTHGEPHLLGVPTDADVRQLEEMDKEVRREMHKMRAFVRFREMRIEGEGEPWFVAWFEPTHQVLELNGGFFADRFSSMKWSILTPQRCAHWNGRELTYTAGVPRPPEIADEKEALWKTYYASIFNPARVKRKTMEQHMPRRYWKNLPEAESIGSLLSEAGGRMEMMMAASRARDSEHKLAQPPDTRSLSTLREAALGCRACPLWKNATQTVFGEGPRTARYVFVGEQPGDQEDLQGRPFVGPAGQMFERALQEAGLVRDELYLTNAVKHFKWEPRGKRRLHSKPSARDIASCRPWLEAELRSLRPKVIVALGATAATSLLEHKVRVLSDRGQFFPSAFGAPVLVTIHPSMLLRLPDEGAKRSEYAKFVQDLEKVRQSPAAEG